MVMGMLAASSVLGLDSKKQLTLLPEKHPWQTNVPFHIGLRTGFCGSLTTFATLQTDVLTLAIQDNAWVNAIVALTINLASSLIFYSIGTHIAMAVDKYMIADHEDVTLERISYISTSMMAERAEKPSRPSNPNEETELELERDLPRSSMSPPAVQAPIRREASQLSLLFEGKKTHCVTVLAVCGALAGWAVGAALETSHTWVRSSFFSAMFGVFGCWLRYYLAQMLNYQLEAHPWYPMGTLVANMTGTAISFAMLAIQVHYGTRLGYWASIMTTAVATGFCGALTTVSTFVAELVKFADMFPDNFHVYIYLLHSLLGAMVMGIAVYGWAGWTA